MLEITNGVIKFTKGDSVALNVDLQNADGTVYEMQSGDELKFTIRKNPSDNDPILHIPVSSTRIVLRPILTNMIEPGRYCYDIELETSDGNVYTIVGIRTENDRNLIVYPEVTKSND